MIQVRGVHKSFSRLEVLKGIDFHVAEREVVCIIGPSGSGKALCCAVSTSWKRLIPAIFS